MDKRGLSHTNNFSTGATPNLLSQTLSEWAFAAKDSFDVLCVCSDKTVGKRDKEDMALGEAPFSVTSELSVISDFISNNGHKVIFCTYQSSDLIAEVQSDKSINPFDLVIADEAHRCSGKSDTAFSKVLDGEAIRATKRLFTTATPRLYSSGVKKAAADRGIEVYGMDDEAVFGPVLHTLTFGQAIAEDLLNDYQVVIVGVDHPMIKEWIENQELLGVNPNNVTDARTLAAKIGLLKTIKNYDLTRVISFHSRVNAARDFAEEVVELADLIEPSNRPKGTLWSSYVSGAMRTTDRILEIGKLKSLQSADIGVLANARCLSEGVDVPSLDGIAFIDPRGSQVDIIQAVGRAIRKVRGAVKQTKGTIVLPVFIEEGDDAEAQIEASNFKPVWDVLKALRSHDEVLADHLDQYRTNMAKKSGTAIQELDDRIIFDLPKAVNANFSTALKTVLVESTTASWYFWLGLLREWFKEHGHTLVPPNEKIKKWRLGQWVSSQRSRSSGLNDLQKYHLNELNFVWSPHDYKWELGFKYLLEFKNREGHCLVPKIHKEKGFSLGSWVGSQRMKIRSLDKKKILRLDQIGFVWNTLNHSWQINLQALQNFYAINGHTAVPTNFVIEGLKLGEWVKKIRQRKASLSSDKLMELSKLDFAWNLLDYEWERNIKFLEDFVSANGHTKVPQDYFINDVKLGFWISNLRQRKNKLSHERIKELDKLGFAWKTDKPKDAWDLGITNLKKFYQKHGHSAVPKDFVEGEYKLGIWVNSIRGKKESFSEEQKKELSALEFSWDILEEKWLIGFENLRKFISIKGHCMVPHSYKQEGFNLGSWVNRQRFEKNKMPANRKNLLNGINFVWNAKHEIWDENWKQAYKFLIVFYEREGNCLVPSRHVENGFNLGSWVNKQRTDKIKLNSEQKSRLDELDFIWSVYEHQFSVGLNALSEYQKKYGDCLVPAKHVQDGFRLGNWVQNLRKRKQKLDKNQLIALKELGFVWRANL
jgi:superfamily II DNA or RNA helicase